MDHCSAKWIDELTEGIKSLDKDPNDAKDLFDEGMLIFDKLDVCEVTFDGWSVNEVFNSIPDDADTIQEHVNIAKLIYNDIWKECPVIRMIFKPTLYAVLFVGSLKLLLTVVNIIGWFKFWHGYFKYEDKR